MRIARVDLFGGERVHGGGDGDDGGGTGQTVDLSGDCLTCCSSQTGHRLPTILGIVGQPV